MRPSTSYVEDGAQPSTSTDQSILGSGCILQELDSVGMNSDTYLKEILVSWIHFFIFEYHKYYFEFNVIQIVIHLYMLKYSRLIHFMYHFHWSFYVFQMLVAFVGCEYSRLDIVFSGSQFQSSCQLILY